MVERSGRSFPGRCSAPPKVRLVQNKELSDWDHVTDAQGLETAAASRGGERIALFIDEAQEIRDFERPLRSLAAGGHHDIWVTGSNARLLSGEIAGLFAGRTAALRIRALDYGEFLRFHDLEDSDESLAFYLRYSACASSRT